jgi:eukaryotic-like serine/threonine-protein kinase
MQQQILDNRYELLQKIGEGGMARVFLGRDLRLNRQVAIKLLSDRLVPDPDFLSRFRHEAQAAAILNHPNIVGVYDVGQDGDAHYIVMEYVEGLDLKKEIMRYGTLDIERAVSIAIQVAQGLDAAHRVGLVHRDIKPQNIIISPDGAAHITDFGVAKSRFSTAMTETGITLGTVDYISPEQAQGQPATARSDIYSLGVTLFEMLTGRLPFSGDGPIAVAMQHVGTPPPAPRQLNPQIPPQLEALLLRAMAKNPAQRFAGAAEFANQLRNYRSMARQETVLGPGVQRPAQQPQHPAAAALSRSLPEPTLVRPNPPAGSSGRINTMPPPRPAPARPVRQQSSGCGTFLVGMFVLVGVLGLVLLFSTGAFDDMIGWGGVIPSRPELPSFPTSGPTETPGPTPTVTATPAPLVRVPNLVNRDADEAMDLLSELNLLAEPAAAYSDAVPRDRVIDQAVPAGSEVEEGSPVTYTVSLGLNLVAVPELAQRQVEIARQQAEARGLSVEVIEEPSRTIDEGFVIRQQPSPDLLVAPGSTVRLVVSIGDRVRFPDVIGRSRSEAEAAITTIDGLSIEFIDEQGPDRLPNFNQYAPNEVVSALANGRPVANGDYVPRGSNLVLGVRAP